MASYIMKRAVLALGTIWVVITITFILMHSIPGDPFAMENKRIPQSVMDNLNKKYGLDQPLHIQYITYLKNILRGDLGLSFKYANRSVNELIKIGFPTSAKLGLFAVLIGCAVGIFFGIVAGIERGKFLDYFVIIIAIIGVSVPGFVFAGLFQYLFGVKFRILPVSGWNGFSYYILPVIALSMTMIASLARMMRTSMLDVTGQDYIKLARSKGLNNFEVVKNHCIRNAISPVVTLIGGLVAGILVGSFVIETIFRVPGMGVYLVTALQESDYTVIMGISLFYAAIVVVVMFFVDIVYMLIDPRIKINESMR